MWLISEQMGFPLRPTDGGKHEERAEDFDTSQRVRDQLVAYHLAPAIADFILSENRECCNNELEQTLTLLHSQWSKEIEMPTAAYDPRLLRKQETPLEIGKDWFLDQKIQQVV